MVIDVGYYRRVLHVTRDVGAIVFNPIKPVMERFSLEEAYIRRLDGGVVLAL